MQSDSHNRKAASAGDRLTVLHLVQPVDGGVARVVIDLVRAQTTEGLRAVVGCPPGGPLALRLCESDCTRSDLRTFSGARLPVRRARRGNGPGFRPRTRNSGCGHRRT
ncbi:hypothetical protein ACM614_02905, partial [Streptomyces sp. 12297]